MCPQADGFLDKLVGESASVKPVAGVGFAVDRGETHLVRIVATAPAERPFEAPAHPYSASLLSAVPRIDPLGRPADRPCDANGPHAADRDRPVVHRPAVDD